MTRQKQQKEEKDRKWLLILLLLLILIIALVVAGWALFFRTPPVLTPDYAPRQQEPYAEDIGDSEDTKLDQAQGGGAVSITYTTQVAISLLQSQARLSFANPTKSNQDMVLQLVVQDVLIAQSGAIPPGKRLDKLDLLPEMAQRLSPGGYEGIFRVLFYQPDTHEKTIVNTEIPVQITVEP